ncbi:hypothetical protein B296_00027671 [Ensete ventricosum]|uniref:Uncharacterized protein n=1 Tax=Ensete ventricosum TaxID=4639 RepID=A0A426XUC8_ENSVE|nr:hypothetical protein B296_00027671 [Ensete ventricosum]
MNKVALSVEFRLVFRAPSRKFKILAILDVLAHGKSYEHGFTKKHDRHILYVNRAQTILDILGSRTSTVSQKNSTVIYFTRNACSVEFRSVFRTPSQKFKILAIPDLLAHGMSYERGFTKKCDDYKLCTKSHAESSFDRFFFHALSRKFKNTGHSQHISP